jgi:hypothetical protein
MAEYTGIDCDLAEIETYVDSLDLSRIDRMKLINGYYTELVELQDTAIKEGKLGQYKFRKPAYRHSCGSEVIVKSSKVCRCGLGCHEFGYKCPKGFELYTYYGCDACMRTVSKIHSDENLLHVSPRDIDAIVGKKKSVPK